MRLTTEERLALEKDVQTPEFSKLTYQEIGAKYHLSTKRARDAVHAAKMRLKNNKKRESEKEIPMTTITAEELQKNDLDPETAKAHSEERDEIKAVKNDDKTPTFSLIDKPATASNPEVLPPSSNVLDGNKFYCATCLRIGKQTILEKGQASCPGCGGVLIWEN